MHRRVLLPLDGSVMAEQALPFAVAQAERFRSELILLRAVGSWNGNGQSPVELGWVQDQMGQWARDYLESIATQVRVEGVPVKVVVLLQAPPHEAITQFAEVNGVDLIVICSRGQSGPSRWLMGSVADRVVRGAATPVLLVRASE